jgi:hypothetical protein
VSHFNGTVQEEDRHTPTGAIGLRYPVVPWRAREAIIIPLRDTARPAAEQWRTVFGAERDWLPWALSEMGLPTLEEILPRAG